MVAIFYKVKSQICGNPVYKYERETSTFFRDLFSARNGFLLRGVLEKQGRMAGQNCELRVCIKPNK